MAEFMGYLQNKAWEKKLKKALSEDRYEHTLRVAERAYTLAEAHHYNQRKATVAGYLHDCAKNYKDSKLLKLADKYHIRISEAERNNTDLLHAKVGAYVTRDKFKVPDPDIFNAITYHTTGRPSMSVLEKILYISDYTEPGRRDRGRMEAIRKLSFQDLDETMLWILEDTLDYLSHKSKTIDPLTKEAYNYYKTLRKDNS